MIVGAYHQERTMPAKMMIETAHQNIGDILNKALAAPSENNPVLSGVLEQIDFTRVIGKKPIPDAKPRQLITHFRKHRMRNEDFEHRDLLGSAYEYLVYMFAESAGKKGGEFYTLRDVVSLMVRLVDPREGQRIYEPCCGSGGMLIYARQHVREHSGNADDDDDEEEEEEEEDGEDSVNYAKALEDRLKTVKQALKTDKDNRELLAEKETQKEACRAVVR